MMATKRRIYCRICDAPFHKGSETRGLGENGELMLPREQSKWMNELRFIGKIPGHLAGIRFKSQSLEYSLEYSHDDGGAELVVYRPREEDSEGITKIQEDCYSLYTEQGEEQDTVPFPIHSRCIELLRRLVKAYELTQDDIWRVFSKVSLGNNDIQKTDTFQENSIPDHDASKEKYLSADPITIPSLTEYILSLLRPLPTHPYYHQYHQRSPSPEFSSSVCYANYDRHEHQHQHLQHEQQRSSRDGLISGAKIPYLLDLDREVCIEKDRSGGGDQVWDWEGLVEDLYRSSGTSKDAPMGWRNRCRIWESARQRFAGLGLDVGTVGSSEW